MFHTKLTHRNLSRVMPGGQIVRGRRRRMYLSIVVVVSVAAVSSGVLLSNSSAGPSPTEQPGGVASGVSALVRLPAVADLPTAVAQFVRLSSRSASTSVVARELKSVRLLRSDMGDHFSVYAFRATTGSVCYIVVSLSGSCPTHPDNGTLGFQWTVGGGHSGQPSRLVGIVADGVKGIDLVVDGQLFPVSVENNFAYAEFPASSGSAAIHVHEADGSVSADNVQLQG